MQFCGLFEVCELLSGTARNVDGVSSLSSV